MRMNARPDIVEIRQNIVIHAQVAMRFIEMADVSLYRDLSWAEQFMLRMVRAHYLNRMRSLFAVMPSDMTAEILAASDKLTGLVRGFTQN